MKPFSVKRLMSALFLLAAGWIAGTAQAQSLFARARKAGGVHNLIADHTARAIGDILTILIKEEHYVIQEDKTARYAKTSLAASLESFDIKTNAFKAGILPDIDIRSNRIQEGKAKQERDTTFEARVAVTVADVLPNGNLVIRGQRAIFVDDEEKILRLSGVIRQVDITAENTIESSQVAEAKVSIIGKGKNSEFNSRGPIGKLIETAWWLVWPF